KGFDVLSWLNNVDSTPDVQYLLSAPVSLPLIGLLQLTHYAITCKVLGVEPGELKFAGITGHSQGIVTAAAVSIAKGWDQFYIVGKDALRILFWIGCRSQQTYPRTSLTPAVLRDSIDAGEGNPSPMLSVRDLSEEQIRKHVD